MNERQKQEEFLLLMEPLLRKLSAFARALAGNYEDARDLVSETILQSYQCFTKIKKKDSFKSYVFTIASRLHKRKFRRSKFLGIYNEELAEQIPSRDSSPEINADVSALYEALAKLPEKQRQAVIFFEISGFSLEEIRKMQGGTLSGVKSRIKRGRELLAKMLAPEHTGNNNGKNKYGELDTENGLMLVTLSNNDA